MYERADLAEKPRLPDDAGHRLMSEAWEQSSRSPATRTTLPDVLDFSKNDPLSKPEVWLGNKRNGVEHGDKSNHPSALGCSPGFRKDYEMALKSLPQNLQNVMKGYETFATKTADDFVNHLRNKAGLAITDVETRNDFRRHYAGTDPENHVQAFVEWTKSPVTNRWTHFTERMNMRGTAAHEAEHANDFALGQPSQNDAEFDRLYKTEANQLLAQLTDPGQLGPAGYYIRADRNQQGTLELDPPAGKTELFAELGAIAVTGETSGRQLLPQDLVAIFPETYKYVCRKIQSGEW